MALTTTPKTLVRQLSATHLFSYKINKSTAQNASHTAHSRLCNAFGLVSCRFLWASHGACNYTQNPNFSDYWHPSLHMQNQQEYGTKYVTYCTFMALSRTWSRSLVDFGAQVMADANSPRTLVCQTSDTHHSTYKINKSTAQNASHTAHPRLCNALGLGLLLI